MKPSIVEITAVSHFTKENRIKQFFEEAGELMTVIARSVLPNATASSMVMSLNLRSLIHFCSLRMCSNAQDEIREVANKMAELVIKKEPWLADYLAPKCKGLGYCNEIRPCGLTRTKAEALG